MSRPGAGGLALAGVALAAVVSSCWTAANVTTASPDRLMSRGEAAGPRVDLPASCVAFLAQLQCRLRVAGNEGPQIDRVLGALRASLESPPPTGGVSDPDARCKNDMRIGRAAIESAGCESTAGQLAELPPSRPADCGAREFLFVRRDGRVAGCHRDCATSEDCPAGAACTGVGYAPGGPLDEPFCE